MNKILVFFAAGCVGALANSIAVWLFGYSGINSALGVSIAPSLSPAWIYPRIVWGGIWGLLFVLPKLQTKWLLKGAILSLFPTAVQLFIVFPLMTHKGIAGFDLGLFTPLLVLFLNGVWGYVAGLTIRLAR